MNGRPYAIRRVDLAGLALVLLVAAVLRVGRPDVLHFQYDQAEVTILAQDIAAGQAFSLLGQQSSGGLPNSPMAHLLLALPFLFLREPHRVTLAVGLWNVLGVGLLWLLAHRYVHPRVAVLAGLLYAANPYAVKWSRTIWVQNLHTPLILLALLLALYGFLERRRWAQLVAFPVAFVGLQIHYAGWFLLPLLALPVWWGRRHIDWRAVTIGGLLALLVMLPFGIGLAQHYGSDLTALTSAAGDSAPLALRAKVFERYLPLFTGAGSESSLAGDAAPDLLAAVPMPIRLWALLGLLAALGLFVSFLRPEKRRLGAGLMLWLVLPPLVFWPNWTGVYWHYFVASLPGMALAAAVGADWVADALRARWGRVGQVAVRGLVIVIVLSQGVWYWRMLDWVNTHSTPGGFNTPLDRLQTVGEAAAVFDDVLILGGQSHTSGYEVWHALLYHDVSSVREVVINGGDIAVFPAGSFAVITAPRASPYPVEGLYAADDPLLFPLRPAAREGGSPEGEYRVDYFAEAPAWPGPAFTPAPEVTFANGVGVEGFSLAEGRLYTAWRLPESPGTGAPPYRFFAHFLDTDGERLGQRDFDFWPAKYWRAGDRIILWGAVEVPPGTAILRLGMYSIEPAGTIHGVDAYDSSGAASPWVDLPPDDRMG